MTRPVRLTLVALIAAIPVAAIFDAIDMVDPAMETIPPAVYVVEEP